MLTFRHTETEKQQSPNFCKTCENIQVIQFGIFVIFSISSYANRYDSKTTVSGSEVTRLIENKKVTKALTLQCPINNYIFPAISSVKHSHAKCKTKSKNVNSRMSPLSQILLN